jgi:microcystin-dependent protein
MNGQAISRATNPIVFGKFGTTFGAGDGSLTFNLPDAKGRVIAHVDGGANRLTATYFGTAAILGAVGGTEAHQLITAELSKHRHVAVISDPTHTHDFSYGGPTLGPGTGSSPNYFYSSITTYSSTTSARATGVRISSNDAGGLDTTNISGNDAAHRNVQHTLVMNAQVKLG